MKRKKFFSALMALAMILSLCTFASASGASSTPAPVALAPGSAKIGTTSTVAEMVEDMHLTVSGIGDKNNQTVPAALAGATINYTVAVVDTPASDSTAAVHTAIATITSQTSVTGWTAAYKDTDSLDLLTQSAAFITITNGTTTVDVKVTPDGQSPLAKAAANGDSLYGQITLGGAGAFEPDVPADSDGQMNSTVSTDSATGDVVSEGPLPDGVINVKVPTDAQTNHAFDLYLDPHDLIKASNASRYGGSGVTLTGDSRLYFKNSTDSTTAMSNESADLKIVNKSSVPVNVELSIKATKNAATDFKFVNSPDAVDTETGPAIYLAIESSTVPEPEPVSDTATGGENIAKLTTSLQSGGDKWYDLVWHGDPKLGYYSYDMNDTYAAYAAANDDDKFESLTFNLTGKINDNDAWTDDGNVTFALSVIWEVKEYVAVPGATVATALTGSNTTLTLNLDFGESSNAKAKADITFNSETKTVTAPASGHTATFDYPFTGTAVAYAKLDDSATVVFYNTSPTETGAVTVNLTGVKAAS